SHTSRTAMPRSGSRKASDGGVASSDSGIGIVRPYEVPSQPDSALRPASADGVGARTVALAAGLGMGCMVISGINAARLALRARGPCAEMRGLHSPVAAAVPWCVTDVARHNGAMPNDPQKYAVAVQASPIDGRGAFAAEAIPARRKIGEIRGEPISVREARRRARGQQRIM